MFSLKRTIASIDEKEARFDAAVECFLGTILDLQDQVIDIMPELTREYKITLRTLHREVFHNRSLESLASTRAALIRILEDHREKAQVCLAAREDDVRTMIIELASAADTMGCHNDTHSVRLKEFTEKLQTTARATSIDQMKRDLTKHVAELRSTSRSIWMENHNATDLIQAKLKEFQGRLELAEKRATTDSLTGLLNRGEGESRLRQGIEQGKWMSVLLIDLNGFKKINDQWGHLCGDQVLRVFSRHLEKVVRPTDLVCRWGGDEFLVLCRSHEPIEHSRAEKLQEILRSKYKIVALGKIFEVQVSASVGVAETRAGESIDDLLNRADTDMYQHKNTRRSGHEMSVPL